MQNVRRLKNGFSIIDVMTSLAIFSVAAFTYLYQISVSNTAVARQANSVSANIIAENIAEDLSMKGFGDTAMLQSYNGSHYRYFAKNHAEVTAASNPKYTVYWQVIENQPIQGSRTITITVSWKDGLAGSNFSMRIIR